VAERFKRKSNTVCVICSKAIYRRPSELQATQNKVYCSLKCYGISQRKEIPCAVCGKLLLSGFNKKTCSRICANKLRIGNKYKTGRPAKDKVVTFRILKLRLMEMRGRKCERCEYAKYEILQTHHKDRNRNNNKLENLQLICPNCHYEEHYLEKSWLKNNIEKYAK
jgi:hypothetical protein